MQRLSVAVVVDDRISLDAKGPVRVSEVEGAQKEILTIARVWPMLVKSCLAAKVVKR